jgi:hypothetical protein
MKSTPLLIVVHRYLGIPLSFLFVLWFVSGIAMIYVGGMPALSPQARLEHLAPIDFGAVRLTVAEAAGRADGGGRGRATLLTVLDRPAYRFGASTVFADSGETLAEVDQETTRAIAARFLDVPPAAVAFERVVEDVDQWTLVLRRELPLYKFDVDDGRGTEVYVSPRNAEVTLVTTARSRGLAWIATIPHWFYITSLRVNQPLWYWTVVWTSAAGCVLAALGIVLGVVQFRKSQPFSLSASIPYRGWMRWHYLFGAVFGVFALTWVFSGLLSMEPFDWTNVGASTCLATRSRAGPSGSIVSRPSTRRPGRRCSAAACEGARARAHSRPAVLRRARRRRAGRARPNASGCAAVQHRRPRRVRDAVVAADTLAVQREPFSTESLVARLRAAVPTRRSWITSCSRTTTRITTRAGAGAAAGAARAVRRPGPHVGLRRSADVANRRRGSSLEPAQRWLYAGCTASTSAFGTTSGALGRRHDRTLLARSPRAASELWLGLNGCAATSRAHRGLMGQHRCRRGLTPSLNTEPQRRFAGSCL